MEVSADNAEYLLSTFPQYFHRMETPARGSASQGPDAGVLAAPVRDILPAIRSGEYDGEIAFLQRAEEAGKGRVTVLSALQDRARVLAAEGA